MNQPLPRPQVLITTASVFAGGTRPSRTIKLETYVRDLRTEDPDSHLGIIENLNARHEYTGEVIGRLLECLALGGCDFRSPRTLNYILFGYEAANIAHIEVINPTAAQDDDIPF